MAMTFDQLLTHLNNIKENDPELMKNIVHGIIQGECYSLDISLHMQENYLYFTQSFNGNTEKE